MNSLKIIKRLKEHGWYQVNQEGSHIQFKHQTRKGRVTVPHPVKDVPVKTLKSIERQAGIVLK